MCEPSSGWRLGQLARRALRAKRFERMMERMEWTTPAYDELKMDAEIGSYQQDDELPFAETTERDAAE
jgi:hypothetical protein